MHLPMLAIDLSGIVSFPGLPASSFWSLQFFHLQVLNNWRWEGLGMMLSHNIGRRNYALNWSTYTDNQTMELYKLSVMLLLISAP